MNKGMKKVVCGALASVMLLGTATMAKAAGTFADVSSGSWYSAYVDYAYSHKLMVGTSDTTFSPNQAMTRGMLATVIYSIAGKPAPSKQSPFTDIGNTWYTKAVNWCYGEGIVAGTTTTTFAPNHHVTREQMAVIMRQYAKYMGRDVSGSVSLNGYADSDKIHAYAVDDMQWAVSVGLMTGMSANTIAPRHNTTRAQCAVVLQRFTEWLDDDTAEPQPEPTEPAPTEPKPTEPKPTEPKPTEPPVTEPIPTQPPHTTHTYEIVTQKKPTCTENGSRLSRCKVCGHEIQEVLPATGHDYEQTVVAPTCTADGYTKSECSRCHDSSIGKRTPKLGHAAANWETVKNPTCEADGVKVMVCSRCSETVENQSVPALGHKWTKSKTVTPTCEEKGYTIYTCQRDQSHTKKGDSVNALGHQASGWKTVKNPTCGTTGLKQKDCVICNKVLASETIDKLPHTFVDSVILGTCIHSEKIEHKCSVCGYATYEETGKYGDHVYIVDKQESATCTKEGYVNYRCKECGNTYSEKLESTGHDFKTNRVEPTCTADGYEEVSCSKCGFNEKTIIPRTEHEYIWIVTTPATDNSEGIQELRCSNCDHMISRDTLPRGSQNTQDYEIDMGGGETKTIRGFYNHDYEQQVLDMLNAYRVENGKKALINLDSIAEAAAIRGKEQGVLFSHTRPNGLPFHSVLNYARGENIALGYATPENVMQGWKDSSGHNQNMLRDVYLKVGISCFFEEHIDSSGYAVYIPHWVQLFG